MKNNFYAILNRLKKPSVLLSIVSQVISILIIMGVKVDNNLVMSIAAGLSSIFVTLGILSNPDTQNSGYGEDILKCSETGDMTPHVFVNGQMLCKDCGAVYKQPDSEEIQDKFS